MTQKLQEQKTVKTLRNSEVKKPYYKSRLRFIFVHVYFKLGQNVLFSDEVDVVVELGLDFELSSAQLEQIPLCGTRPAS